MDIIQPLDLESAYRPFSVNGKHYLALSCKLFFPLQGGYPLTCTEAYGPAGQQITAFTDELLPKLSTEYAIAGEVQTPGLQPVRALQCRVRLADKEKTLHITGDRYWTGGFSGATEPMPFSRLPLSWSHAFGGPGYDANPDGCGLEKQKSPLGEDLIKLPNIEAPGHYMTATGQSLQPQNFGYIPQHWSIRSRHLGTYDDRWLKDAFPGFPADFDFQAFYCTSHDQRFDTFLSGGEPFELQHLNADLPMIKGQLPSYRVRSFLVRAGCTADTLQESDLQEVPMRMDTVVFFPNHNIGMLIYRGTLSTETSHIGHLKYLLSAYENSTEERRPKSHYQQSLFGRIHPEFSLQYALSTKDLIASHVPCALARMLHSDDEPVQLIADNMKNRAEREAAEARSKAELQMQAMLESCKARGMDTTQLEAQIANAFKAPEKDDWQKRFDAVLEKLLPGATTPNSKPDLQKIDFRAFDELAKLSEEYAEFQKQKARQQLQDQLTAYQHNPTAATALQRALQELDLPPVLPRPQDPEKMLRQLRDAQIAMNNQQDRARAQGINPPPAPEFDLDSIAEKLHMGANELRKAYRMGAHTMGEGRPPLNAEQQMAAFERRQQSGESHAGQDYAGLDFSNRDLSGIDLSNCYLEQCRFDNCNLRNANLSGSIAARASFYQADLTQANLSSGSIGACNLQKARLNHANLEDCEIGGADFSGADISNTHITVLNCLDVTFSNAIMNGTRFNEPTFIETDFSGADFSNAELVSATFMQCDFRGTTFDQGDFSGANFIECNLNNATFRKATFVNSRFMMKSSLEHCVMHQAVFDNSNFRQTNLAHSDFSEASLKNCDFSEASVKHACFNGAQLQQSHAIGTDFTHARLDNCNLMEANLMQAQLQHSSITRSNCYSAEFMSATTGQTDFSKSNMDATKLEDWRPAKWQS